NGIGAVSAEAVYEHGSIFYFVSEDGKIYQFDGGNYPVEISKYISHYLQSELTFNAIKNVVTTHHKNSIWFTFDNTSNPERRLTLVYFPEYKAWSKFIGIPAAHYVHINDALFFTGSHNSGAIYQYGTKYMYDLSPIKARLKTTKWSFAVLYNFKRFKKLYIRVAVQGGGGIGYDIEFYVDDLLTATVKETKEFAYENKLWGNNNERGE